MPHGGHCSEHESSRPISSLSKQCAALRGIGRAARMPRSRSPLLAADSLGYKVDREYRRARVSLPFSSRESFEYPFRKNKHNGPLSLSLSLCLVSLSSFRAPGSHLLLDRIKRLEVIARAGEGGGRWRALTLFESRVFDLGPVGVHQSGFMPTENSRPLHRRVNIRTLVPFSDLVGSSSRARETPLSSSLFLSFRSHRTRCFLQRGNKSRRRV